MISQDDVQKLATLAHIAVPEGEREALAKDMDSVLGYVSEVAKLAGKEEVREKAELRNIMRDDVVTNKPGEYTESIVKQFPDSENNQLRVKKIL